MSDFIPKMIGFQDVENHEKIKSLYDRLVNEANGFIWETQNLLIDPELNSEILFEMLKKNKAELVLYLKRGYVKNNNISIPGINMEKLISADLVDLPSDYDLIVSIWEKINETINQIEETRFYFPLKRLFDPDKNIFDLNSDFESELLGITANFTETEKQNEILDGVQRFCDIVNDFIQFQVVKGNGIMWKMICDVMEKATLHDEQSERPLIPERKMFKKYYVFDRYGNNKPFEPNRGTRNTIINYCLSLIRFIFFVLCVITKPSLWVRGGFLYILYCVLQ